LLLAGTVSAAVDAQSPDTVVMDMSTCLRYAVRHQPGLRASLVNQRIVDYNVKGALADWLPQGSGNAEVEHYFQPTQTFFPDSLTTPGASGYTPFPASPTNVSLLTLGVTQNIYTRDVMLAARTSKYYRRYAGESVDSTRIDLVVDVSKAYYAVYTSELQLG